MTGGDQREPLWASSLADQPRPDYDDVTVRVLEEPDETASPPGDRQGAPRWKLMVGALPAIAIVALAIALEDGGALTIAEVPSYWGDAPMTCDTVRFEQGERAVEWFSCRALAGRRLPPGLYRSPDSQWTSDITRLDARQNVIRISPEGKVVGWATY
jgi:hypothetical protein